MSIGGDGHGGGSEVYGRVEGRGRRGETLPGKERQTRRKVVTEQRSVEAPKQQRISQVDEPNESHSGTSRTEISVAPKHVDASRHVGVSLVARLTICSFCSLC